MLNLREVDGEKVKVLKNSIKQLVEFLEKGGEVDFVVQDETDNQDNVEDDDGVKTREELRVTFKEVRQIERKLNLIGFKE